MHKYEIYDLVTEILEEEFDLYDGEYEEDDFRFILDFDKEGLLDLAFYVMEEFDVDLKDRLLDDEIANLDELVDAIYEELETR